jgi:uncharacterized damage-inducible protein DinB
VTLADYLRRQFAYNAWANQEVLAAIRSQGTAHDRPLELLAHILAAERLWLERLKQLPQSVAVWPKADLEHCQAEAKQLERLWVEYLDAIPPDGLSRTVSYTNSKGEKWTSTIVDILTHVLMHSAYHRGQIASAMRANGHTPAYTDFIHAIRQGIVS